MTNVTVFVVDTEQAGRSLVRHSMHWFGVMKLTEKLDTFFDGKMCPRPGTGYDPVAMQYAGATWDEIQSWPEPEPVMLAFRSWIIANTEPGTKPQFWADNNGHDKKWMDFYMDLYADTPDEFGNYAQESLLGHSSKNVNNWHQYFVTGCKVAGKPVPPRYRKRKNLSITKHNHTPVQDARGVCESMLAMRDVGLIVPVAP